MDTSVRLKNTILNIIMIFVALFICYKIYGAQEKYIAELNAQKEMELKRNEELSNISLLEKKLVVYKNYFNNKTVSSLIGTIGLIAKESEVNIVSIRPIGEVANEDYVRYPLTLTVEAKDYHILSKFINNLEVHKDVYMVSRLSMKQDYGGTGRLKKRMVGDLEVSTILVKK